MNITKQLGNVTLDIKDRGEYNIEGKTIPHEEFIKVKIGKNSLKFSPRDLLSLKGLVEMKEVREELQKRYEKEELVLQGLKF